MPTRDEIRTQLEGLSDDALRRRSEAEIARSRRYRSDRDAEALRALCWDECLRRGRPELFELALRDVQQQEIEEHRRTLAEIEAIRGCGRGE